MSASHAARTIRVESAGRLLGWVAIDSTVRGAARGGLRLAPDVSEAELREAARAMTLKYGLLRLPQGGAKAGVLGDPDAPEDERRARLLAFGRAIEPLLRARRYVPDADLGTRAADMRWLFETLGLPVGPREWRDADSGAWTATSVLAAARAALAERGRELAGTTVAVEGFGAVGSAAALRASRAGARVVAISTSLGALYDPHGLDVPALAARAREVGRAVVCEADAGERLPRERLFELPADLLLPCARHHSIHPGNASAIRASVVCPGANAPYADGAEEALAARGVLCVPDFVANCGGVLGGTMAFASIDARRSERLIDAESYAATRALLALAARERAPVRRVAERIADERFRAVRRAAEQPGALGRAFEAGLACYRRGWLPGWLTGALGEAWFRRRLRIVAR